MKRRPKEPPLMADARIERSKCSPDLPAEGAPAAVQPVSSQPAQSQPWRAIRRGVWLGLPLAALCSAGVAYGEIRLRAELVNSSLMIPPVCALLILALASRWFARRWPRLALTRLELLAVYMLLIVSVCINGKGMMELLLPTLAEVRYFAVRRGLAVFGDALPRWWLPRQGSMQSLFAGQERLAWHDWLLPFATWTGFLLLLIFTTLCICVLLRQQWVERERLVFPMTVLPLELTRSPGSLLGSRTMWWAFSLVFLIESLNSLNQWYPALPHFPIKSTPELDITAGFTAPPWNALKGWTVSFYPFAIGIAFLLTTEVSFSCWFFYILVTKLELAASVALGLHSPGAASAYARFPYISEQGAGAYFGFALLVLWIAARSAAVRSWISGRRQSPRSRPWNGAVIGVVLGAAGLVGFCVLGGSSLRVALVFWVVTFLMLLTLTRARAEGGTVWALGPDTGASLEVVRITGTALPVPSLAVLAVMQFFTNDWRALVMPNQLESLQMADVAGMPRRRLLGPLLFASFLGIVVSFWASLAVWYRYGLASARVDDWALNWGYMPWDFGKRWLQNPKPADVTGLYAVAVGMLTVWLLAGVRSRLLWWPLHPIGYVLGSSGDLGQVWFCFFLGWLIKSLALRYGGRRMFARMLPFFLGLILGDYAAAGFWSLIGMAFDVPVYKVFP